MADQATSTALQLFEDNTKLAEAGMALGLIVWTVSSVAIAAVMVARDSGVLTAGIARICGGLLTGLPDELPRRRCTQGLPMALPSAPCMKTKQKQLPHQAPNQHRTAEEHRCVTPSQ